MTRGLRPRDEHAGKIVGVLTGGGDAPGLNAAICGLGRRLGSAGVTLLGFRDGWRGVIENDATEVHSDSLYDLLTRGGTILGSSSASPYRDPARDVPRVRETFAACGLHALVAIGGEGTLLSANRLHGEEGLPVVAVPKTIDNDVSATDYTFGFWSAVERVTHFMDDLRTTAESHQRVLAVECMGRHSGWIAAYAGVASGAESILVPERHVELRQLYEQLERLRDAGRMSAILSIAEGTRLSLDGELLSSTERDEWGEFKTGGAAQTVAAHIERDLDWEARAVVLAHLQRAGPPCAFDRLFALRLGARAARLVLEGRFGRMAAMRGGEIADVPIAEGIAQRKYLPEHFLDRYETFFTPDQ